MQLSVIASIYGRCPSNVTVAFAELPTWIAKVEERLPAAHKRVLRADGSLPMMLSSCASVFSVSGI